MSNQEPSLSELLADTSVRANRLRRERDEARTEVELLRKAISVLRAVLRTHSDELATAREALQRIEQLCASFDPTSGSGRARAFVGDLRVIVRSGAGSLNNPHEEERGDE